MLPSSPRKPRAATTIAENTKAARAKTVKPVLKWAGGKGRLAPRILDKLPEHIGTYFEPFVGGAAIFFALVGERRFERAVLSDKNPDLVTVYRALQADVDGVIRHLSRLKYDEEEYYRIRAAKPRARAAKAARLLYLNKTGYNGLYRVNRAGEFNVPFGRYKNPKICDEPRLRKAAQALQDVRIEVADFAAICDEAGPGDAVYFDPPYLPVSKTARFAEYFNQPFDLPEHERLAQTFGDLAKRGVCAVLSNSDTPDTRRLYRAYKPQKVQVARAINSNPKARGAVSELLVAVNAGG